MARTFVTPADRITLRTLSSSPVPTKTTRVSIGQGVTQSTTAYVGGVKCIVKDRMYDAEVAAYIVSTFMPRLVYVPPTVRTRDVDGHTVSLQEWSPTAAEMRTRVGLFDFKVDYSGIVRSDVIGLASFDYIIENADRHPGNFLRDGSRLLAIDHGYSFTYNQTGSAPLRHLQRTHTAIPAYIRSHASRVVTALQDPRTVETLCKYIPGDAVDSLSQRAYRLSSATEFRGL